MDYSSRILNLRLDTRAEVAPMKFGHADARHAAAEIAREAEAKIEELEASLAEQVEWVRRLADDLIVAEAKLAKAVDALEAGVICTTKHGGAAEFLRIARTTLAELKVKKDE
jgi:hypothetical protein